MGSRDTKKLECGELIHVERWIGENLPGSFLWRGRRHIVRRVLDSLAVISRKKDESEHRHHIALCTSTGLHCVLSHDLIRGTWSIEHVAARIQGGRDGNRHAVVR
jgi:hypothetical protein